jgi:hypothetical protein
MASGYRWGAIFLAIVALFAVDQLLIALFGEFWGNAISTLMLCAALVVLIYWRFRSPD